MIEHQLTTLGLLFLFAIIGSIIAKKFKQPVVIGLLVVGTIIGPHTLGLVNDPQMVDLIIEFATIIFLFLIGLEFSAEKLFSLGPQAIIITLFKVGIMFLTGYLTVIVLGANIITAVFIGIIVSFSGTIIIMSVLQQRSLNRRQEIPLLIGVLILEDLMGVIALTFFASMRPESTTSLYQSLQTLSISIAALIIIYIIFSKIAQIIVEWVTTNSSDEAIAFMSLGLCAGFAYAAYALGLSPSAGAFLAGSIVSSLRQAKHFEHAVKPYGAMFTSLFFLACGTMINLSTIGQSIGIILALLATILISMQFSVGLTTKLFAGYQNNQAFFSSVVMLPLGVFSLLLAKESLNFVTNMDLMTITSVLIFILAIIMAVSVNRADNTYQKLNENRNMRKSRIDVFANYIKECFEELTVETTYTHRLKRKIGVIARYSLGSTAVIFGTITAYGIFKDKLWLTILIIAIGSISTILLLVGSRRHTREVGSLIIRVLSGMEAGTARNRTKRVTKLVASFITFGVLGLYFPLLTYMFGWPAWTSAFSIIPISIAIMNFFEATSLLSNFSPELRYEAKSYKKLELYRKPTSAAIRLKD